MTQIRMQQHQRKNLNRNQVNLATNIPLYSKVLHLQMLCVCAFQIITEGRSTYWQRLNGWDATSHTQEGPVHSAPLLLIWYPGLTIATARLFRCLTPDTAWGLRTGLQAPGTDLAPHCSVQHPESQTAEGSFFFSFCMKNNKNKSKQGCMWREGP